MVTYLTYILPVQGNLRRKSNFRNSNSNSRVTIHDNIQIQQLLFKFVALFKMSGTIQIRNMNSARALTREWLRHPNFLLFKALTIG